MKITKELLDTLKENFMKSNDPDDYDPADLCEIIDYCLRDHDKYEIDEDDAKKFDKYDWYYIISNATEDDIDVLLKYKEYVDYYYYLAYAYHTLYRHPKVIKEYINDVYDYLDWYDFEDLLENNLISIDIYDNLSTETFNDPKFYETIPHGLKNEFINKYKDKINWKIAEGLFS